MLLLLLFLFITSSCAQIQVTTEQGTVQGDRATDGDYYTFYGLHYAGAPIGENRFKAPTPAPQYPGTYHAISYNVICAQPSPNGIIGDENCLVLNVFTNSVNTTKPVMVWLVSEEYTNSPPARSFKSLVEEGIVVVQVNHRLSIFGFLCLGVADAPGNAGLKDVVQALKWIKTNIASFGGDPNNVILFGHGSGAAMVDLITMSPLATNLVHKAIVQSGSALSPWAVSYDPVSSARAVGAKLEYRNMNNENLARHLVNTSLQLFSAALNDFEFLNNSILFAPCIENESLNPNDTFLADAPINLLKAGKYSHIPYLIGYTNREGTIRAEKAAYNGWLEKMQANFSDFLQVDLDLKNNLTNVARAIREYYFDQRSINMETIEDYLDYQGDTMILVSVIRAARERALTSREPVRLYEFAYRGTLNSNWGLTTIPLTGARHGAVLDFLLKYDLNAAFDLPVSTSLITRYVRFMKEGNPAPGNTGNLTGEWLPINNATTHYLLYSGSEGPISNTPVNSEEYRTNPHYLRMNFWNDLYFRYYTAPKPTSSGFRLSSAVSIVMLVQTLLLGLRFF